MADQPKANNKKVVESRSLDDVLSEVTLDVRFSETKDKQYNAVVLKFDDGSEVMFFPRPGLNKYLQEKINAGSQKAS